MPVASRSTFSPFVPIRVSEYADEAIREVEDAAFKVGAAQGLAETNQTYSELCTTLDTLYRYVEQLEIRSGAQRIVSRKF